MEIKINKDEIYLALLLYFQNYKGFELLNKKGYIEINTKRGNIDSATLILK